MNLHEFQSKSLLEEAGIHIPQYAVISNISEVEQAIKELQLEEAVLKIQVHAGGRGKAGGVKIARNPEEIFKYAEQLIGMKIQNRQTGPEGIIAGKVLITGLIEIKKEYYLAVTIDRKLACPVLIASQEGGVEIEETAESHPEKILKISLPSSGKIPEFQFRKITKFMNWTGEIAKKGKELIQKLFHLFMNKDITLLEINPLVLTQDDELLPLDAKITLDEDALFRHTSFEEFFDPTQISSKEAEAKKHGLSYVALEGNIGCMVNGAGLAMATMDIINLHGGTPANFLDVGGGASEEKVKEGFKIILSDQNVKAILINIFGGIMNCATLASGIVAAARQVHIGIPVVVRMEGTHVEKGKEILAQSGFNMILADNLDQAAEKVIKAIQE